MNTALLGNLACANKPFQFTILTAEANDTFTLPLYNGGVYNFTIDWGDSSTSIITAYDDADVTHTYVDAGASTYNISISGTLLGWKFENGGDKALMKEITQWGCFRPGNTGFAFQGCSNMTITATDNLNLASVTSLSNFFQGCGSITTIPSINSWNMSKIQSLYAMFHACTNFNSPLNNWNLVSCTNTGYVFYGNGAFNQDITGWDMSHVTYTNWMFYGATAFNQAVGVWNTSVLASADSMFNGATAFDQSLAGWDITALAGTHGTGFLAGVTLSTVNYSATLISWGAQEVQNGVTINFGNSLYSAGDAATARAHLVDVETGHSWVITDGGQE